MTNEEKMISRHEIVVNMAKAFFATAWADWCEQEGSKVGEGGSLAGCEILDVMPEVDPSAVYAAFDLCDIMERENSMHMADLFERCREISARENQGDRPRDEEHFGHYAAMQAMGHGVGLGDAFGWVARESVRVPHFEFGYYDFDPNVYPIIDTSVEMKITVEYDSRRTDADCVSNAMDTLVETALSTPGILDDYGPVKFSEFNPVMESLKSVED